MGIVLFLSVNMLDDEEEEDNDDDDDDDPDNVLGDNVDE